MSTAAPIVLLDARGPLRLPEDVAPGLATLGFMLPSTPLHHLMFRRLDRPIVMTERQSLRRAANRSTTTMRASGWPASPIFS